VASPTVPSLPLDPNAAGWLPALNGLPDLSALGDGALLAVLAGLALLGLVMLLWGRLLHRALLVLVAGGIGLVLGGIYGPRIELSPFLARLGGAVTCGLLGLVLARAIWAALAGLLVAGAVGGLMLVFHLGQSLATTQPAVAAAYGQAVVQQVPAAMQEHGLVLGATTIGSGLIALIAAFLLPRVAVIAMTSLLGASLLSTAIDLGVGAWAPPAQQAAYAEGIAGCVALGLLAFGLVFQGFYELRARRSAGGEKGDSGGRKKPKAGSGDEK